MMSSPIVSILVAVLLLQLSTLSYGFLFGKPKTTTMAPLSSTTTSTLSALVPGSPSHDSIHSGSSSSFGSNSFLPSHIHIRQTNMNNKDQELAVKLMMDAVKRFGYKIGKYHKSKMKDTYN